MNKYDNCNNENIVFIISVIVVLIVLFMSCTLIICFIYLYTKIWHCIKYKCSSNQNVHKKKKNNNSASETFMQRIKFSELVLATENWDRNRILGEGAFGIVYKGNWRNTDVAIKRLKSDVGVTIFDFLLSYLILLKYV